MSSYQHNRSPGPVSPRWLNCPRKSATLIGGLFLALKTPITERCIEDIPAESKFTPEMFFDSMRSYKIKIGLWIDLTNTQTFYDRSVIRDRGANYVKIACRGHGECPSLDQVASFIREVGTFSRENPKEAIAVHCSDGFNRTGFMIISYLIEHLSWNCEKALSEFASGRSPGIFKQDYIDQLFLRYNDTDVSPRSPSLPKWCLDEPDEDDDIYDSGSSSGKGIYNGKVKPEIFMEGVPGVEFVSDECENFAVQKRIQEICGWTRNGFPGCQPVSMTMEHMTLLSERQYKISWNTDGTRYMMFIDDVSDNMYFADRDFSIFKISGITFPDKRNLRKSMCDTLLDGEMVIDINPNGVKIPRYLIYDAIRIHGKDIMNDNFQMRFDRIHTDIISPRLAAIEKGIIIRKNEPFGIRRKDFWIANSQTTAKLLSKSFTSQLLHEPDGLILQPNDEPYVAGVSQEVLKWKPASHNSVDFKVKIVTQQQEEMPEISKAELYVGNSNFPFAPMKANKTVTEHDGKIIECKFENDEWVFMRVRTDKSYPNSYDTVISVCQSISNPVTEQILLEYLRNDGYSRSDEELTPPPAKKRRLR